MKLFFETAAQANLFLLTVPVGIAAAAMTDLFTHTGAFRPLWDVLAFLFLGAGLGLTVILLGDAGLRSYHILAVLVGAILYFAGIRRLLSLITGLIKRMNSYVRSRN